MGLIKALSATVGSGLADQWLETIEPDDTSEGVVFTQGIMLKRGRRGSNTKHTVDAISNGSIIHVPENQCALLVDGGAIVDFTAEPGMFEVKNSSMPSLMSGDLGAAVKETFNRFRFGGDTPLKQQVFYVNLQEMKGIKFGTKNPINYFDDFYNSELFLRAHGTYTIKITDPILFFREVLPKGGGTITMDDIAQMYMSEFLEALQTSINQMSADGIRISYVASRSQDLSKYMADVLDDKWHNLRGMDIQSVGIASISYDDESKELINMRNRGAMLSDASIREGFVQGSVARGIEAAGSNEGGAMGSMMGVGVGMSAGGAFMGASSQTNQAQAERDALQAQMKAQQEEMDRLRAEMANQQAPAVAPSAGGWACPECGTENEGNFCKECGTKKPEQPAASFCTNCGHKFEGDKPRFCPECGSAQ